MGLYEKLVAMLRGGELSGKTIKQIFTHLGISKGFEKDAVRAALVKMEKDGLAFCINSRYLPFEEAGLVKGKLRCHEKGYAFLVPESPDRQDYFIPPHAKAGAHHGDEVYVRPVLSSRGSNDEAEVVRIAVRRTSLVGTYQSERTFGFVIPDERGYGDDIFVPFKKSKGAVNGDKVLVKITSFPHGKNPEGEIEEVLGKRFDLGAEERSVVAAKGIPDKFPQEVTDFISGQNYNKGLTADGREDLRGELIVTIDGQTAKDLDDAISLKTCDNGHFLLGVHIADVSHYVEEGGVIDREALRRGTSVYFPDTVIPMLPKELSNGICSLHEGVERYALSCFMEIDGQGEVVDKRFSETLIKSSARLTYDGVDDLFEGRGEGVADEVQRLLYLMRELANILIEKRGKRGSIDLDVKEAEISVDAHGEISITPSKRTLSHKIIEEFMILANESVAEFARYTEVPFLFRVHEKPREDAVSDFIAYLRVLGISVRWSAHGVHPGDYAKLLEKLDGSPLHALVNKVMLRSMSKAKYFPENLGHFGLASENYCHFTSPIRRYPDLVAHRAIKHLINGQVGEWIDRAGESIYEVAKQASECERRADEAERDVDDIFKARYMKKFIGCEFDGIVSGVTSFGVFVELPFAVEGLIKLDTLPPAKYEFDKASYSLSSRKLGFTLGDAVRIMVAGIDSASKKIEFIFVDKL